MGRAHAQNLHLTRIWFVRTRSGHNSCGNCASAQASSANSEKQERDPNVNIEPALDAVGPPPSLARGTPCSRPIPASEAVISPEQPAKTFFLPCPRATTAASRMEYAVEGETITPAVLSKERWSIISGKSERPRQTRIREKERLCLTQPQAGSTTAGPAQQTGKRRKPPLPRLPEDDRKVVVRPSNLNLRTTTPGQLLKAICEQLNLPPQETFANDRLRITPYTTFTNSTPVKERAEAYRNLSGAVISGALGNETPDEILHYCITETPQLPIVNARRMGRSRAAVITFEGTNPLKKMIFQAVLFTFHSFKERVETCLHCRRVGHQADVCYRPKSQRCNCSGEEHPPPEEGEPATCEAKCIIWEGRSERYGKPQLQAPFGRETQETPGQESSDWKSVLPTLVGRRRQPRVALEIQTTVVTPTPQRKSVEGQVYFVYPPLDDHGTNSLRSKSNERKKPLRLESQQHHPERRQTANAGEREFLEQTRKLTEENAAFRRRLDELEKLVKTGPNSTLLNTPAASRSAPPTPTQIATDNAMDTDANHETLKRQALTDLDADAKIVAEASLDGEPQPKPKTTVTSQAHMRKNERLDQLEKDNQETKDSLSPIEKTIKKI
ncbi:hypothetical protein HPB47_006375 [Ixodes persulcatus]|uniref:Uncharacterized protein n=1 Tax=Ixodes persulcatus TaxID=34615 RepID=A0AC60PBC4_IXOPE|nr:hypothetical protein HPB47_006375 [Ixodes persulcatus]